MKGVRETWRGGREGREVVKQVGTVFIVRDDHLRETISKREKQEGVWNPPRKSDF